MSRFKETPSLLGHLWALTATQVGGRRSRSRMRLGAAGRDAPDGQAAMRWKGPEGARAGALPTYRGAWARDA